MKKTMVRAIIPAILVMGGSAAVLNEIVLKDQPENIVEAATAQQVFVEKVARIAQTQSMRYGVYPSVMIAQAVLESGSGTSELAQAPNNNYFGIKYVESSDKGKYGAVYMLTWEYDDKDNAYQVNAPFRTYPNLEASFADNGLKIRSAFAWNPELYKGAWLENASSYTAATAAIGVHYATSGTYAAALNSLISTLGLTKYDPQYKTLNQDQKVKVQTNIYNTFSGQKKSLGSIAAGTVKKVLRQVTLPDGSKYNEIASGQWVMSSAMTDSSSQGPSLMGTVSNDGNPIARVESSRSIAVYKAPGTSVTGQKLSPQSNWKVFGRTTYNGQMWYKVGTNDWIEGKYLYVTGYSKIPIVNLNSGNNAGTTINSGEPVAKVEVGHAISVWTAPGVSKKTNTLAAGSRWKVFGRANYAGDTWYKVGTNDWIEGKYLSVTGYSGIPAIDSYLGTHAGKISNYGSPIAKVDYLKSIAVHSAPNGTRTGQQLNPATSWKVFGRKIVDNETWYKVGTNDWINGKYVYVTGYSQIPLV